MEDNKALVARAIEQVINGGDLAAVDELYAPEIAADVREWVAPFRAAFPDVRMETVALVAEGETVVGHFRCSGTHTGPWMGRPGTGRAFRNVREVYWFTVRDGGGSRTTTTGVGNSAAEPAGDTVTHGIVGPVGIEVVENAAPAPS